MKYESSFVEGSKVNNYTYYLRSSDATPARLEFVGFDRLFGSHYDKYIVNYDFFQPISFLDPSVFYIPNSECMCVCTCVSV